MTFTVDLGDLQNNILMLTADGNGNKINYVEVKAPSWEDNFTIDSVKVLKSRGTTTDPIVIDPIPGQIAVGAHLAAIATGNILVNDSDPVEGNDIDVNAIGNAFSGESASYDGTGTTEFDIAGQYGDLHINMETGAYTYTPHEGLTGLDESAIDTFSYTVIDNDTTDGGGNAVSNTATLTFNLNNVDTMSLGAASPLNGTDGDDLLYGTSGNDVINAGDGNDFVYASSGSDTVTLGDGDDTIVIDPAYIGSTGGTMTVTDFDAGEDFLQLADSLNGSSVQIDTTGSDITLVFGDLNLDGSATTTDSLTVILSGVTPAATDLHGSVDVANSDALNDLIQSIIDNSSTTLS